MSRWRPDVGEERRLNLSGRVDDWLEGGLIGKEQREAIRLVLDSGWRGWSGWVRIALFLFTIVGVVALGVFVDKIDAPASSLITGVISIVLAEMLIASRRWFFAGVEEALWIAGPIAIVIEFEPSSARGWLFWLAVVFLVAAFRLLNALFAVVAGVFLVFRIAEMQHETAAAVALVAGLTAALLLTRRWRRPFHDRALSWCVIVLPLLGYALLRGEVWTDGPVAGGIVLIAGMAVCLGAIGIARRLRAPLISSMLLLAATSHEIGRGITNISNEVKLMIAGAALLAIAMLVDRWLRKPREGWTSQRIDEEEGFSLLEMVSAAGLSTSHPESASVTQSGGEGGRFGGGGASGDF